MFCQMLREILLSYQTRSEGKKLIEMLTLHKRVCYWLIMLSVWFRLTEEAKEGMSD